MNGIDSISRRTFTFIVCSVDTIIYIIYACIFTFSQMTPVFINRYRATNSPTYSVFLLTLKIVISHLCFLSIEPVVFLFSYLLLYCRCIAEKSRFIKQQNTLQLLIFVSFLKVSFLCRNTLLPTFWKFLYSSCKVIFRHTV